VGLQATVFNSRQKEFFENRNGGFSADGGKVGICIGAGMLRSFPGAELT
jgi:hypothetical protein